MKHKTQLKDPKFYPCTMQFDGEFCGGIAVQVTQQSGSQHRSVWVCQRCDATWDAGGNPTIKFTQWDGTEGQDDAA